MAIKLDYQAAFEQNKDEEAQRPVVTEAGTLNRISIKSQGYKVDALDNKQQLRQDLSQDLTNDLANDGGSDLEQHPELAELFGDIDISAIPESEIESVAANNPELANKLRNRKKLAAQFGMSQYISENSLKAELSKKLRARAEPDAPRNRNRINFRPPGM